MPQKIRIEDVAAAAGVSTQTISRVLNNRPDVSRETREKVLSVMEELGYQPSLFARGLAGNKSYIIGMITDDLAEPTMARVIAAIEQEARRNGYFLLVSSTSDPGGDRPIHARMLTSGHVDGLLFSRLGDGEQEREFFEQVLALDIPRVAIGSWPDARAVISSIELDEMDASRQAARYLLSLGHRRIGMITGPLANSAARGRVAGFEQAMQEAAIAPHPNRVSEADWSFAGGYEAALRLLAQAPDLTALFCHNDRMAIAAIQALQQSGRRVPDDISVIGFDDIPDAAYVIPALTTMHQSFSDLGREAARLLFEKISNTGSGPRHIQLQAELVQRESCRTLLIT